jgi:hypothetical protein
MSTQEQNRVTTRFMISFACWAALSLVVLGCSGGQDAGSDLMSDSAKLAQRLGVDDGVQADIPPGVVAQTAAEALEMDLALIAEGRGWSVQEARLSHEASEAVGRVAIKLAKERLEMFVGSVLSPDPAGRPRLLVKGQTDEYLRALVADESVVIDLVDNQPFSASENDERIQRATETLKAMGYSDFSVAADIQREGRLLVSVRKTVGLPSTAGGVAASMPADLSQNLEVSVLDHPIGTLNAAFGGMLVFDTTGGVCTSGWSVGTYSCVGGTCFWTYWGVTTSGHCTGMDTIVDPADGSNYSYPFEEEHVGAWGDIERHTANTTKFDDFYARSTDIRDVTAVESAAGISVGEDICLYSRVTNVRGCSTVNVTNMNCGTGALKQVHMNSAFGVGGDSGSGHSFGNKAYGSHTGNCWVNGTFGDFFSVADYFDDALGTDSSVAF